MNNLDLPLKRSPTLLLQVDRIKERIAFLQQQLSQLPDTTIHYRSGPRDPAVLVFDANLQGRIEELQRLIQ
jgi:hypothetical protein